MLDSLGKVSSYCAGAHDADTMKAQKENLWKARYLEWEASLFGAIFIAFGVGALWGGYLKDYLYLIILAGIVVHSWGMYKVHKRNT